MSHEKIPLAGVIGHPINHSRSPALHGHWLRSYGIQGHYIPMDIAPDDFAALLRALPKMGFVGVNVTIPHKEAALRLADRVTDRAVKIGAANTLTFQADGKIHADNTDGIGFMASLRQSAPNWDPTRGAASVIGAGGAARAVIWALLDAGVPEIRLSNRTKSRADALAAAFGNRVRVFNWLDTPQMFAGAATVVNTTAIGMSGKDAAPFAFDALEPGSLVTDLVYNPLKTDFLAQAELQGCQTVDGLGMLLHQAAPGFERWFGTMPQVDLAARNAVLGA